MSGIWRTALTVPAAAVPAFSQAIEELADTLSTFEIAENGPWQIEMLCEAPPDRAAVVARLALAAASLGLPTPQPVIEPVAKQDWVAINQASFRPRAIGRFVVRPGHDRAGPPRGRHTILLDAGVAFGTGEHATTQGCLQAMDALARCGLRPRRILDLGCGSGILAVGAAMLWPGRRAPVRALDIDIDAVRMTRENARRNCVSVRAARSHGGSEGMGGPYGLIVANILARPLIALAGGVAQALAPGGFVVLSGLLVEHEGEVLRAYRARGLVFASRRRIAGWSTLVLRRRGKRPAGERRAVPSPQK